MSYQDPYSQDDVSRAIEGILGPRTPGAYEETGRPPFQLDTEHRLRDLERWGGFQDLEAEIFTTPYVLDARQMRALFATVAVVLRRSPAERAAVLGGDRARRSGRLRRSRRTSLRDDSVHGTSSRARRTRRVNPSDGTDRPPEVPLVQIYGLTTVEDAAAVDALRPDHVGVVLDEGLGAWDSVDNATARAICDVVVHARVVGLSLSGDPARIISTVRAIDPDIVHLVRASALALPELERVRTAVRKPLMLTVPVTGTDAVAEARRLASVADYLLLDSREPQTGVVGATGLTHDWEISAAIVDAVATPVFLAGGLGPHNVLDALQRVRPAGVDSETHTSRATARRRKDLDKVRNFIDLARSVGTALP